MRAQKNSSYSIYIALHIRFMQRTYPYQVIVTDFYTRVRTTVNNHSYIGRT
ncbi:MAG: hypothetical protein ACK574_04425 [Bacteroidota bacterium]